MTSLNSQESSNDICKLTDKQQAEYHNAYQEYIAQMAQMEGLGAGMERPGHYLQPGTEDKTKECDLDTRKPFPKGRSKVTDVTDGDAQLDPITEEDEKPDPSVAARTLLNRKAKTQGQRYQSVPSDEDESGAEGSESTPLLSEDRRRLTTKAHPPETVHLLSEGAEYLSESPVDKKDSSDSGLRSSGSSSNHSLQDADSEPEKTEPSAKLRDPGSEAVSAAAPADLIELMEPPEGPVLRNRGFPRNLSGLQESVVMRMSICSEAPSEGSMLASSPEENWPNSAVTNLNRSSGNSTLDNINSANSQNALRHENDSPAIIISPGSTTTSNPTSASTNASAVSTTAVVHNENLRAIQLKRLPAGEGRGEEEHESVL